MKNRVHPDLFVAWWDLGKVIEEESRAQIEFSIFFSGPKNESSTLHVGNIMPMAGKDDVKLYLVFKTLSEASFNNIMEKELLL